MKKHSPKSVQAMPDFPKLENELLEYWYQTGVVYRYLRRNQKSNKYFSFLDGPITANNPMGVHHGWGRTYKDLWQRFNNMRGYKQRFQNGYDSQGLWVEVEVEKELGFKSKKDIEKYGVAKFVAKCRDRVAKYSHIQTEQSKRLGYFMDWDHSYFTMSEENNYMIWHFLKVCNQNGWLYKGLDSVPWCPRCETAISQHEMLTEDYKEVTHDAIYLAFPIVSKIKEYLLIWTTTPWTIPANIAVAVDKELDYSLVKTHEAKYWVAKDSAKSIFKDIKYKVIKQAKGTDLVGLKYKTPFDKLPSVKKVAKQNPKTFHTVVPTDTRILPISTSEGTGMVHTAVSAGTEDFKLGKKLGLPMIPVIDDSAYYFSGFGELSHKNAKKHPDLIFDFIGKLEKISQQHWIFKIEKYKHRYPACWRCKQELVWKVTDEWYIAMDKGKPSLRERMKRVAKRIKWIPEFGLDRELDWLNNMQDWLISKKNRYWGLCLPIWECQKCGSFEVMGSKLELKKRAYKGWEKFEGKSPHKPQLDEVKIKCKKCGEIASRVEPVGNPWLDAGIVPFSTISTDNKSAPLYLKDKKQWKKWFPADFITESFPGQFKNWFYSLIAMSTVLENQEPFKTVLGFATLLAEDGRPMHKSWGNAIEFNDGAEKIGVDVMRWMYCRQEPKHNLLFGIKNASLVRRQFHLILWNSYRFVVNNLILDKPKLNSQLTSSNILDHWILSRLNFVIIEATKALEEYDVTVVTKHIEQFVQDFSTWYIRRSRSRIGPTVNNKKAKEMFYENSLFVLTTISKLLAPLTPFLSDITYRNLTGEDSVHLSDWPEPDLNKINKVLEKKMNLVREIVFLAHAERKKENIRVRQPLAKLSINGCKQTLEEELLELIADEINIKEIKLSSKGKTLSVKLDTQLTADLKAEGQARELIRRIQQERKKLGTKIDEKVQITVPSLPPGYKKEIKQKTLASSIKKGEIFKVVKDNFG